MKDLLLYVADADALGFMRSMLDRPAALGIRQVTFDIERHPQRDAGMIQSGAELARMKKGSYRKAMLIWDHHGSGREHKLTPLQSAAQIQGKLDTFTWMDNSTVVVLVPELEQGIWHCVPAVAVHGGLSAARLQAWVDARARALNTTAAELQTARPKDLFEFIMRDKLRRTISPHDFEQIGRRASVRSLSACQSFRQIVDALRDWFPRRE